MKGEAILAVCGSEKNQVGLRGDLVLLHSRVKRFGDVQLFARSAAPVWPRDRRSRTEGPATERQQKSSRVVGNRGGGQHVPVGSSFGGRGEHGAPGAEPRQQQQQQQRRRWEDRSINRREGQLWGGLFHGLV